MTSVLPRSFAETRLTARQLLMVVASVGCGLWSFAGIYPQFDDGKLRFVLALSSMAFAPLVLAIALKARSPLGAFGRAVALAAGLGISSALAPLLILFGSPTGAFFGIVWAFVFGIPTGLAYGVAIGALAVAGFAPRRAESCDGTDRAGKRAGAWLVVMSLGAVAFGEVAVDTWSKGEPALEWVFESTAVLAVMFGLFLVASAAVRLAARRTFVSRVAAGAEPLFRLRPAREHELDGVARIGGGRTVLDWLPEGDAPAYRAPALGQALAVLDD